MPYNINDVMREQRERLRKEAADKEEARMVSIQEERRRSQEERLAMFRDLVEAYYDMYGQYPWQGEYERW